MQFILKGNCIFKEMSDVSIADGDINLVFLFQIQNSFMNTYVLEEEK